MDIQTNSDFRSQYVEPNVLQKIICESQNISFSRFAQSKHDFDRC